MLIVGGSYRIFGIGFVLGGHRVETKGLAKDVKTNHIVFKFAQFVRPCGAGVEGFAGRSSGLGKVGTGSRAELGDYERVSEGSGIGRNMTQLLLMAGADVNAFDSSSTLKVMQEAVTVGNAHLVSLFLSAKNDQQDNRVWSAFVHAFSRNHLLSVQLLLDRNAKSSVKDEDHIHGGLTKVRLQIMVSMARVLRRQGRTQQAFEVCSFIEADACEGVASRVFCCDQSVILTLKMSDERVSTHLQLFACDRATMRPSSYSVH
uniref:ANK_REP_REGION domain-containing protein n=1 Tax=Angiostrongylus cantonensis TaxID=6313 RepID=A0A0K0CZC7_ANGCA